MLIKLMLRGMKKNWLQFISVMLMAFLGIYLYTGVNASWYSLQAIQDTYYSETNMADLWVYGSFDENDYQKIMEIGSVKEVDKRVVLHAIVEQKEDTGRCCAHVYHCCGGSLFANQAAGVKTQRPGTGGNEQRP